jgi:hypothetical protein
MASNRKYYRSPVTLKWRQQAQKLKMQSNTETKEQRGEIFGRFYKLVFVSL